MAVVAASTGTTIYSSGAAAIEEGSISVRLHHQGGLKGNPNRTRRGGPPGGRDGTDGGAWVLKVDVRQADLESIVSASRQRNLAVSVGIIGLMLLAGGALVLYTRRSRRLAEQQIEFGANMADFGRMESSRKGRRLDLAAKELELLRLLVNHRGQVLTRERILKHVWKEQPHITSRTVDVHIAWLRQKLEDDPQSPQHLLTIRGEGYSFRR